MNTSEKSTYLIAIIVPNKKSASNVSETFSKEIAEGKIIVHIVGPQDIKSGYEYVKTLNVDAIMVRGGTYKEFVEFNDNIPLVEMKISMLDILDTLKRIEDESSSQEVYLALNENISYNSDLCRRFINMPLKYLPFVSPKDLAAKLSSLPRESLVVGSGFVSELNDSAFRFHNIMLKPETLRAYYAQTVSLILQIRKEQMILSQLQTTFSQIEEGIIILDDDGVICNYNEKGMHLLCPTDSNISGKPINVFLTTFPFINLLGKDILHMKDKIITINSVAINLSIISYVAFHSKRYYLLTLRTVSDIQRTEHNVRYKLAEKGLVAQYTFSDIITHDEKMLQVIETAKRLAKDDNPILIRGESGTGKELFAQSIHLASSRSDGPFVAVNCAALSESLLESELFGYVGGAFTGARKEGKVGLFELAHKGTVFLDEINSMSPKLQAKLLRVIEERQIMRIGSDYVIPLDIRILSASNQSLRKFVNDGDFRLDLYYRLNTLVLRIPPLRERKADIVLLFKHYISQKENCKINEVTLSEEILDALYNYEWPGNVRELRSAALRYVIFDGDNASGDIIPHPLPKTENDNTLTDSSGQINLNELTHTVEDLVIQSLLNGGMHKNEVAKTLGISRQALYKKINKSK